VERLDARGAVSSLFIGHGLVPEKLCGIGDMVQRLPAISPFLDRCDRSCGGCDWPSNQVRRKRVGLSLLAAESWAPSCFPV
jgi:hypothetical protein